MQFLERLNSLLALAAAWAFFAIGLMLGFEVTARYFFNSPTIWAEEISRLTMVWAVFIGGSTLIRNDEHIRVTMLVDLMGPTGRRIARIITLLFLAVFSFWIFWNSLPAAINSFESGRSTGSMLDIPSWWMQSATVVGFALIVLQILVELGRTLLTRGDIEIGKGNGGLA